MNQIIVSVLLCSRNPRPEFLRRTLDGLSRQTLDPAKWELIIVDNGSSPALDLITDLSSFSTVKIVVEPSLGLTPARLRGIENSTGLVLVFVDDDNVLSPDYLATALELAYEKPYLGAWGGSCLGEFECGYEPWLKPYLCYLAVREVTRSRWTNVPGFDAAPFGAGLVARRELAQHYLAQLSSCPERKMMDRAGDVLMSGGDSDLAFSSFDLDLGIGIFPSLKLTHLIPKERLELGYLTKLMEGMGHSMVMLAHYHGMPLPNVVRRLPDRWIAAYRLMRQPSPVRILEAARNRGIEKATRMIAKGKSARTKQ